MTINWSMSCKSIHVLIIEFTVCLNKFNRLHDVIVKIICGSFFTGNFIKLNIVISFLTNSNNEFHNWIKSSSTFFVFAWVVIYLVKILNEIRDITINRYYVKLSCNF